MNETAISTSAAGTTAPKRTVADIEKELQEIEIRAEQLKQEKIRLQVEPLVDRLFKALLPKNNLLNCLAQLSNSEVEKLSERLPSIIIKAAEEIHGATVADNERRKNKRQEKKKALDAAIAKETSEINDVLSALGSDNV